MKTGEVVRKNFISLSAVYWDAAAAGKVGGRRSGRMCWINPVPPVSTGVLWHPEGAHWELAVQDLCPRCSAQVSAVPQAGGSAEAHPQRDEMGPR